jgi:hypothetical protein
MYISEIKINKRFAMSQKYKPTIRGFKKTEGVSYHRNTLTEGFFKQQIPCHTYQHWKRLKTEAVQEQTIPLGLLEGTTFRRIIVNYVPIDKT